MMIIRCIPETRADGVKIQWTQGLHGHKTLAESGQMSLRANFQDYMMHEMHNYPISDIKQEGQLVIEFGTKREGPVLQHYQHQDVSARNSIGRGLGPQVDHCYHEDDDRSFKERDPSSERQQYDRHKASYQRRTPQ